jgi:hypothetical protein
MPADIPAPTTSAAGAAFDRQVRRLLDRGYPRLAGMTASEFTARVAPLRDVVTDPGRRADNRLPSEPSAPSEPGSVPFVLVITRELAPVERAMTLTTLAGKSVPGFVDRIVEPGAIARFTAQVPLPDPGAYVLFGVERGEEFCGVVPTEALATITARQRTPLTIGEGVALITQHPRVLERNKCFSLGASRCGDRRVPAIWIGRNAPKLGWCWEGNPHTWLGMASAAAREAA